MKFTKLPTYLWGSFFKKENRPDDYKVGDKCEVTSICFRGGKVVSVGLKREPKFKIYDSRVILLFTLLSPILFAASVAWTVFACKIVVNALREIYGIFNG